MSAKELTKVETPSFTEEEIKDMRETFHMFNQDNDGVITMNEVKTVLVSLGQDPTKSQVQSLIEPFDTDGDGTLNFDEFLGVVQQLKADVRQTEDDLVDVFRVLDQDGDGYISQADLRDIIIRLQLDLTHEDMEEMIAEVDKDGDGQIDYEEFLNIAKAAF